MVSGAQLFTLRDCMQNKSDIRYSMKKVAEMGYRYVQVSGIGKAQEMPPEELAELCESLSLKIVITHNNPERLLYDTDAVIRENKIMGCEYLGIGGMPDRYRRADWLERFALDYREAAKKIAAAGMLFMYHNHAWEFAKVDDRRYMEHLMDAFAPDEMGFTLDVFWAHAGGADVCQWAEKLRGRIPCVHLKDMSVNGKDRVMKPVMEGNMNFDAILPALEKAGTKYLFVEQDECQGSPIDCLRCSYDNLASRGYK